jgi:hypothetical protein
MTTLQSPLAASGSRRPLSSRATIAIAAAASIAVLVAAAVIYLAHQRGAEIAEQRAQREQTAAAGKLVQAFAESKGVIAMTNGSQRPFSGADALLLSVKPVAGEKAVWNVLGRTGDGIYFGQRFGMVPGGAMKPLTRAREVPADVALGELRAELAAGGANSEAARAFVEAAGSGEPVAVRR